MKEQSDSRTPGFENAYKRLPKADNGKQERARRKECHGNWHTCESEHTAKVSD